MKFVLKFLPEVEEDLAGGYVWYESKAAGIGEEFLRTFYAGTAVILRSPALRSKIHQEFRRYLLRRFPYAIYYLIEGDKVIVFGLFHCARDPRGIHKILRKR